MVLKTMLFQMAHRQKRVCQHTSRLRVVKTPGRPANAAYRAKIAENVDNYRNTSNREEKLAVRMRVMEELTNEGYYFVSEKESTWTV